MKNLRFAPAALLLAGFIGVFFAACAFGAAFQRVPNTTIVMPPVLPTYGYSTTNAFGALDFLDPVCIATPPGETNRLFVVERGGTIAVITNLAAPNRTVFLSIPGEVIYPTEEEGLLAMAFHPGFATNGYFYVWYTGPATNSGVYGTNDILSRFQVSALNTNYASPSTELRIISQYDRGQFHNAGCLAFGPSDGYLYVSLGDENCCDDYLGNAQLIDHNFFSGIIRIDVDK
jgi:glucose/arabinose dehydrogenase